MMYDYNLHLLKLRAGNRRSPYNPSSITFEYSCIRTRAKRARAHECFYASEPLGLNTMRNVQYDYLRE